MSILTIEQLNCHLGGETILENLHLNLGKNEILCLLGASGCGKTTLLKAIAGLIPSEGNILLENQDLQQQAVEDRKIGLIFQDYALFPHLTVAQNIQFGLCHCCQEEKQKRTQKVLSLVKLAGFENRFPHELSGGQQQRVAVARALVCRPRLLLLDEPFSNIDSQTRQAMILEIRQILKDQGVPAIFVTHSKEEAFAFADKIAVMEKGKIIQIGKAEQLYYQPSNHFVAEFMGGVNYVAAEVKQNQLHTPLGILNAPLINVNGHYQWLIRPEQLRIVTNTDEALSQGIIQDKLFLGQYYRYLIKINDDLQLQVYQSEDFPLGSQVNLAFTSQQIALLPCCIV